MNNHSYPTLSPQPIQQYPGMVQTQSYHPPSTNNPITLGIPVNNNTNMPKLPMQVHQGHIPRSTPPVQQTTHSYVQLPQHQVNPAASPYYTSQKPIQHQNSNIRDQNGCYIELTDSNVPEPAYAPFETKREENTMITGSNMPHIQYPQLTGPLGPMTPSYSYQTTPNPEMSGPVIYDPSLLEGVTSREPQLCHCARCNRYVQTVVHYKTGKGAILSGVFMGCMGGMPLLCSWVPCVLKEFKDAVHHCPVCGDKIGTKKFLVK